MARTLFFGWGPATTQLSHKEEEAPRCCAIIPLASVRVNTHSLSMWAVLHQIKPLCGKLDLLVQECTADKCFAKQNPKVGRFLYSTRCWGSSYSIPPKNRPSSCCHRTTRLVTAQSVHQLANNARHGFLDVASHFSNLQ